MLRRQGWQVTLVLARTAIVCPWPEPIITVAPAKQPGTADRISDLPDRAVVERYGEARTETLNRAHGSRSMTCDLSSGEPPAVSPIRNISVRCEDISADATRG